jgi:CheY-like chemotaxis protein
MDIRMPGVDGLDATRQMAVADQQGSLEEHGKPPDRQVRSARGVWSEARSVLTTAATGER